MARRLPPRVAGMRRSAGRVSGRRAATTRTITTPRMASDQKTLRQSVKGSHRTPPPRIGATIGATATTTMIRAKKRVSAAPSKTSRTTARESTTPAPAVNPWRKRPRISTRVPGASAHSAEARTKRTPQTRRGPRRPRASLTEPMTTCPTASPIRQEVRLAWTWEAEAPRSVEISGKAGRYMSMLSGPSTVSMASRRARPSRSRPVGLRSIGLPRTRGNGGGGPSTLPGGPRGVGEARRN